MLLRAADNRAPTRTSLTNEARPATFCIFTISSPLAFLEKKVGRSRNIRAITAFCTCSSRICWIRVVYRLRVNDSSRVPTIAPMSSPVTGRRSTASPAGMTESKMSLLAIGVNRPSRTTTREQTTSSSRFGPDITSQEKRIKSFSFRGLSGKALVKVMALGFNSSAISRLPTFRMLPSCARYW